MHQALQQEICENLGMSYIDSIQVVQELWGGYGQLFRCRLVGANSKSVVVKHIRLSEVSNHPRGWNTKQSHYRKLRSYHIEAAWYSKLSKSCDEYCRIPKCFYQQISDREIVLVLEDLKEVGFPIVEQTITWDKIKTVLRWLANFHAAFLRVPPLGLWEVGTYWHLATRPDELNALSDLPLKTCAESIDKVLNTAKYQTIVHGDAKLANYCFSEDGRSVAAVDFQYVGGGCGMKDLAYFIGSCLMEEDCEKEESRILDYYFSALEKALEKRGQGELFSLVEKEWRELYYYAWADFHRFLKGWSPQHWKINSYSERITQQLVAKLS